MKLVEFIIASSLLTLIPGPDILFVLTQSILHGKRAGISVALGLCSGLFFHTAAAALGLSLIIASSPALFAGIKYAGICYLLWMGYASLRALPKNGPGESTFTGQHSYRTAATLSSSLCRANENHYDRPGGIRHCPCSGRRSPDA